MASMARLRTSEVLLLRIGAAVAQARLSLGWSQDELASKSGLHRTYVSDVERGLRNVSILTLNRIARAMDVHVGSLFSESRQTVAGMRNSANAPVPDRDSSNQKD